jgi:putative transposase
MNIKTVKVKHFLNFTKELSIAKQIAEYSLTNKRATSKDVSHFGLKSAISNQILRKYSKSKTVKSIKSVKLTIPNQSIKVLKNKIKIVPLNIVFDFEYIIGFEKINQIEIDKQYFYVSLSFKEVQNIETIGTLGIDRNSTKHIVVCADNEGKIVRKFGKKAPHIRKKYKNIRTRLQKLGKFKAIKNIKDREKRIVRDINHKISHAITQLAFQRKLAINFEDLKGIRKAKVRKINKHSLNSWSFYQFQQFVEYKAKKLGIPVFYVAPQYTSKSCSKCGFIGTATNVEFKCQSCSHATHRDVNAAINVAKLKVGNCIEKKINTSGTLISANSQYVA